MNMLVSTMYKLQSDHDTVVSLLYWDIFILLWLPIVFDGYRYILCFRNIGICLELLFSILFLIKNMITEGF